MLIRRRGESVLVWAPAKVNLFLEVLGKRPDGYHDLATLMVTVGLFDTLEVREAAAVALTCDDAALSTGEDNLVVRAARLLQARLGVRRGASMALAKRIPMQAGLAGGSSDAAAALLGLNALWRLGLSTPDLSALGAELGSDVSFFFHGPAAWCTGRGEVVEPMRLGAPLDLVLAVPRVGLSTAAVFKNLRLTGERVDGGPMRGAAREGNAQEIGRLLFNRLEGPAEQACPEVARVREALMEAGATSARMSGSGSVVYAACRGPADAWRVARALAEGREAQSLARVIVVRSCD